MGREWDLPPYVSCEDWVAMGATNFVADDETSNLFPLFGGPVYPVNVIINHEGIVLYSTFGLFEDEVLSIFQAYLGLTNIDSQKLSTEIPDRFVIEFPFPNPFNPQVNFNIALSKRQRVRIDIYTIQGALTQSLADGTLREGKHQLSWKPENLPSGVYIIRYDIEGNIDSQRVIYIR